jgi:hypothetical protein
LHLQRDYTWASLGPVRPTGHRSNFVMHFRLLTHIYELKYVIRAYFLIMHHSDTLCFFLTYYLVSVICLPDFAFLS